MNVDIVQTLSASPARQAVVEHAFFKFIKSNKLDRRDVATFLGQYWYPMHYFPTFLARLVAAAPNVRTQCIISRILWQELGEGNPANSHEDLYITTMTDAGLEASDFVDVPGFASTKALIEGYERSSQSFLTGLGWLYGTEVNDLAIVVGLGRAVRQISSKRQLPWVSIHAKQEPGHVADASEAVNFGFTGAEMKVLTGAAEESWRLWASFFTELHERINASGQEQPGQLQRSA